MNRHDDDFDDTLPRDDDATIARPMRPAASQAHQGARAAGQPRQTEAPAHDDADATVARAARDPEVTVARSSVASVASVASVHGDPEATVARGVGDPVPEPAMTWPDARELGQAPAAQLPQVYSPRSAPRPKQAAAKPRQASGMDRSALPSVARRDRGRRVATLVGYVAAIAVSIGGLWWLVGVARDTGVL